MLRDEDTESSSPLASVKTLGALALAQQVIKRRLVLRQLVTCVVTTVVLDGLLLSTMEGVGVLNAFTGEWPVDSV